MTSSVPPWTQWSAPSIAGSLLFMLFCLTGAWAFPSPAAQSASGQVGCTAVEVGRPDDSTFSAYVVYPAETAGWNAPINRQAAPYPAISFGHGWMSPPLLYADTMSFLASQGYVVIASRSEIRPIPDHPQFAMDLSHCLTFLEQAAVDPASQWFEMVDADAFGIAGHSMGGGASILAAAGDARIKAVGVLAPANTWPLSSVEQAATLRTPLRIVAGGADALTPLFTQALPHFIIASHPSQLLIVPGGSHCGFLDVPIPPPFCDSSPDETPAQRKTSQRLLQEFFDLHLKGDESSWSRVWGPEIAFDASLRSVLNPGVRVEPFVQSAVLRAEDSSAVRLIVSHLGPEPTHLEFSAWRGAEPVDVTPRASPLIPAGQPVPIDLRVGRLPSAGPSAVILITARPAGSRAGAFAFGFDFGR